MTRRRAVLALVLFAIGALEFQAPGVLSAKVANPGDLLWLPPNVTIDSGDAKYAMLVKDGRSVFKDGNASVVFHVDSPIERSDIARLAEQIVSHFDHFGGGWKRRVDDYLNPGLALSFDPEWKKGCSCIVITDEEGHPYPNPEEGYAVRAQWQNRSGDVIAYRVSATFSPTARHDPRLNDARGMGSLITAETVRRAMALRRQTSR